MCEAKKMVYLMKDLYSITQPSSSTKNWWQEGNKVFLTRQAKGRQGATGENWTGEREAVKYVMVKYEHERTARVGGNKTLLAFFHFCVRG